MSTCKHVSFRVVLTEPRVGSKHIIDVSTEAAMFTVLYM